MPNYLINEGDPYWAQTTLLLHMDGADGSTTFTDSTGLNPVTSSTTTISTAQSKFGDASAYFNGSTAHLSIPSSANFQFGNGDFTVEGWFYITSVPSTGSVLMGYTNTPTAGLTTWAWDIYILPYTNYIMFEASSGTAKFSVSSTSSVSLLTWHYVGVYRASGVLYLYLDGTLIGSTAASFSLVVPSAPELCIGYEANSYYTSGYLDEWRITKGYSRIRGVVPTSSFSSGTSPETIVNYLIVAGGGGGGYNRAGGGGAGGMLTGTTTLVSRSYTTIIVGSGGSGATYPSGSPSGSNGENSVFKGITAYGGGGAQYSDVGHAGGSGGGSNIPGPGGAGTVGQGNAGGSCTGVSLGSGGGGAGGAGSSDASSVGGIGLASSITGTSVMYATGGHGGIGDSIVGATGTGNGGSSASSAAYGGAGGSGTVILSYPISAGLATVTGSPTQSIDGAGNYVYSFTSNGTITLPFLETISYSRTLFSLEANLSIQTTSNISLMGTSFTTALIGTSLSSNVTNVPIGLISSLIINDSSTAVLTFSGTANINTTTPNVTVDLSPIFLTSLPTATIATGINPFDIIISPDNVNTYVPNFSSGSISQYSVNQTTGQLSALSTPTVSVGANPTVLAITTDGKFVFAVCDGNNSIVSMSRNISTGILSFNSSIATHTENPASIALSPNGLFLYVGTQNTGGALIIGTIELYSINQTTGILTYISNISSGWQVRMLCITPDGLSLYASNQGSNTVTCYSINSGSGVLTLVQTISTSLTSPYTIRAIDSFVYVNNSNVSNIYSRNRLTSQLSYIDSVNTSVFAINADGTLLYGVNGYNIQAYYLDQITGLLAFAGSSSVNVLTAPQNFNSTAWHYVSAMTAPSTTNILAPDGTNTASMFSATSTGSIYQDYITSGLSTATFSCYIKGSTSMGVNMWWLGNTNQYVALTIDLNTGVTSNSINGTPTLLSSSINLISNGFYRVSISGKGSISNNTAIRCQIYSSVGSFTLWGAQLELTEHLTPYTSFTTTQTMMNSITTEATGKFVYAGDFTNNLIRQYNSYASYFTTSPSSINSKNYIKSDITINLALINTVLPIITGNLIEGQTLSVTNGTWASLPTTYTYQWQQNGSIAIVNATSNAYILTSMDANHTINCIVTAFNAYSSTSISTLSSDAIIGLPINTTLPIVSGVNIVGNELTVTTGVWNNNPISYVYQWRRDGIINISGAINSTYTSSTEDSGRLVSCVVTASNIAGNVSIESNSVSEIGLPVIIDTPIVASNLVLGSNNYSTTLEATIAVNSAIASDLLIHNTAVIVGNTITYDGITRVYSVNTHI